MPVYGRQNPSGPEEFFSTTPAFGGPVQMVRCLNCDRSDYLWMQVIVIRLKKKIGNEIVAGWFLNLVFELNQNLPDVTVSCNTAPVSGSSENTCLRDQETRPEEPDLGSRYRK